MFTASRTQRSRIKGLVFVSIFCICMLYLVLVRMFRSDSEPQVPEKLPNKPDLNDVIIAHIRAHHLMKYDPSTPTNYSGSRDAWELHQKSEWKQIMSKAVARRLNFKRNGFFIECGALDGAFLSNSLLLEREYDWTGLLIEADPAPLAHLKNRNRRAWVADVCLSPQPYPMKVLMYGHKDVVGHGFMDNKVIEKERLEIYKNIYSRKFEVQCFPLGMLLAAVDTTQVDYFSLDVEGVELDILKTIQFDKIHIKLISVEVRPNNAEDIRQFLESVGYKKVEEIKVPNEYIHDHLYEFQGTT